MLTPIIQNDNHFHIFRGNDLLFPIKFWRNPSHSGHLYLELSPPCQTIDAKELFTILRRAAGRPLQVMVDSDDPLVPYLLSGGFVRRRRCLEVEVTVNDLIHPLPNATAPFQAQEGSWEYSLCSQQLYDYYTLTHQAINPLTASFEQFKRNLPRAVLYAHNDEGICHYAFIESGADAWEIAYVGSLELQTFPAFALSLLAATFRETERISFECDDTDPAAMALCGIFQVDWSRTFDTFIFP